MLKWWRKRKTEVVGKTKQLTGDSLHSAILFWVVYILSFFYYSGIGPFCSTTAVGEHLERN